MKKLFLYSILSIMISSACATPGNVKSTPGCKNDLKHQVSLFSATVKTEISAPQIVVFEHIVPIDLTSILTGYGLIPSVVATKNQTGAWDAAGQTRTVILSDGSTINELLTKYEHPSYFSYTASDFTGILRHFATSMNGEWWFATDSSSGVTYVKWRYTFNARSKITAPIVWTITKVFRGYMRKVLRLSKLQIENSLAQQVHEH